MLGVLGVLGPPVVQQALTVCLVPLQRTAVVVEVLKVLLRRERMAVRVVDHLTMVRADHLQRGKVTMVDHLHRGVQIMLVQVVGELAQREEVQDQEQVWLVLVVQV